MRTGTKLAGLALVLSMILTAASGLAEQVYDSGTAGNISWKISESTEEYHGYALTISGEGDMQDYDPPYDCCPGTVHAPWVLDFVDKGSPYGKYFNQIFIEEGVTRIGKCAFSLQGRYCSTIREIVIPSTVKSIGSDAFEGTCVNSGTRIIIPDSVETIEPDAIHGSFIIICSSDSEAYRYAKENANSVELTDVSIELPETEMTLQVGDIVSLNAEVTPSTVTPVYSSSYDSVAAVDPDTGRIIALRQGDTRITVRVETNCQTCDVHVQQETIPVAETMKLPFYLTEIDSEAFAGTAARKIVVSNRTAAIGARAFADCPNLRLLEIPGSVETISDDMLSGSSDVIIVCPLFSEADMWARERGYYITYSSDR